MSLLSKRHVTKESKLEAKKSLIMALVWWVLSAYGMIFADPSRWSLGYMLTPNFNYFSMHILDKFVHLGIFFLQAWFLFKWVFYQKCSQQKHQHQQIVIHHNVHQGEESLYQFLKEKIHFKIVLILAFWGALVEILQHLVTSNRQMDIIDWAFDVFGVLMSVVLFLSYKKSLMSKLTKYMYDQDEVGTGKTSSDKN